MASNARSIAAGAGAPHLTRAGGEEESAARGTFAESGSVGAPEELDRGPRDRREDPCGLAGVGGLHLQMLGGPVDPKNRPHRRHRAPRVERLDDIVRGRRALRTPAERDDQRGSECTEVADPQEHGVARHPRIHPVFSEPRSKRAGSSQSVGRPRAVGHSEPEASAVIHRVNREMRRLPLQAVGCCNAFHARTAFHEEGSLYRIRRDSLRSARTLPPVWQWGQ
jgi:hypothetical protein